MQLSRFTPMMHKTLSLFGVLALLLSVFAFTSGTAFAAEAIPAHSTACQWHPVSTTNLYDSAGLQHGFIQLHADHCGHTYASLHGTDIIRMEVMIYSDNVTYSDYTCSPSYNCGGPSVYTGNTRVAAYGLEYADNGSLLTYGTTNFYTGFQ
jgi:hypothetical protein